MNMQHILPIMALGLAFAQAGERSTFDFGWKFKYFGPLAPGEKPSAATCDGYQAGHAAQDAIDGKPGTRWCAPNGSSGHWLAVKKGPKEKVETIRIVWENGNRKEAIVEYVANGLPVQEKITVDKQETEINVGGRTISDFKITVNGTGPNNWASISELTFCNKSGHALQIPVPEVKAGEAPEKFSYDDRDFKAVQLPHDWAIESPFLKDEPNETGKLPWNGYGWYRKFFNVPADFNPETQRYYLDFDGVMACPQVYVNGKKAGEWAYGYASFRVDITRFLKPGKPNLIAVQASNKPSSTRWYPGAGIYRHVWLEKTAPLHIAHWGVFVTTPKVSADRATVKIQTTVENTGTHEAEFTVQQKIESQRNTSKTVRVAPHSTAVVEQEIDLNIPRLWSCETPNLYNVETTVMLGSRAIDKKTTSFGVRNAEWKPDGFYLNGKRVQLNGVCEHHDLGPLGAAFHSKAYERKIIKLKEMGCNSIRMTHNPPAPEVLDLCDKHGILVLDEMFDIWKHQKYDKVNGYHVFWEEWWKKDVKNFVERDRNHPCIIAWSGGNEIPEITTGDGVQINKDLRDEFRKYDTTRPYTCGVNAENGAWNGFGDVLDVYGYNYKPWAYSQYAEKKPDKPYYASETASCVATRDTYFFPVRWGLGDGARAFQVSAYGLYAPGWGYCPDAEFTAQEANPNVAGEYVWTGFDYIGEPTPYNQDASNIGNTKDMTKEEQEALMAEMKKMGDKAPSRSSYFGIIDLAGFPKDTYYLYQAHWRPELAQAHILPHWNWKGREGEVTPVMVFSSGDEAELFLNGKSLGVRKRGMEGGTFGQGRQTIGKNSYRFVWEDVKYEPGTLEVVVKKDGNEWAKAKRVTTGETTAVKPVIDTETIDGDGRDLAFIELALTDKDGNVVPTDCRKVSFSVEGAAELVGFCNGNPIDWTCMQNPKQSFFNGRILAVVRGKRAASGPATVTVKAEGLPEVKVPVKVKAVSPEKLNLR